MMKDDAGLTLVELMIASALFLVALLMFGASLYVTQRMQIREDQYSQSNDAVHLAMQTIDRQIRSGYVVTDTAVVGTDDSVKIFTEAGGTPTCVIWALAGSATGSQSLYTTSWSPVSGTAPSFSVPSKWRLVATGIVNSQNTALLPMDSAFLKVSGANSDILPSLSVRLYLNASSRTLQTIEISSTFTSRNVPRTNEQVVGLATGTLKGGACGS